MTVRRWARAATDMLCGYNPQHVIDKDTWHLLVQPEGLKRSLVRCALCAGELVPPELESQPVRYERFTTPMVPLRTLRFDVKQVQAGRDD